MTNKMVDFTSIKKKATRFRFSFLFLAMSSAISLSACGSEGSSKKADTTPSSPVEHGLKYKTRYNDLKLV